MHNFWIVKLRVSFVLHHDICIAEYFIADICSYFPTLSLHFTLNMAATKAMKAMHAMKAMKKAIKAKAAARHHLEDLSGEIVSHQVSHL